MEQWLTMEELVLAARTVWQEARGEPRAGKRAVVHVLMNRALAAKTDMATEALRPWQFSGWNRGEQSREAARKLTLNSRSFRNALCAVLEALEERASGEDPTSGARHYHADYVSPNWSRGKTPVLVIGRHLFFNNIA